MLSDRLPTVRGSIGGISGGSCFGGEFLASTNAEGSRRVRVVFTRLINNLYSI